MSLQLIDYLETSTAELLESLRKHDSKIEGTLTDSFEIECRRKSRQERLAFVERMLKHRANQIISCIEDHDNVRKGISESEKFYRICLEEELKKC